jgi:hypothetical protein
VHHAMLAAGIDAIQGLNHDTARGTAVGIDFVKRNGCP